MMNLGYADLSFVVKTSQSLHKFTSNFIELCEFKSLPAIKIELPNRVIKVQRRKWYRTPILEFSIDSHVKLQVDESLDLNWVGYVKDISFEGIGISIEGDHREEFLIGQNLMEIWICSFGISC